MTHPADAPSPSPWALPTPTSFPSALPRPTTLAWHGGRPRGPHGEASPVEPALEGDTARRPLSTSPPVRLLAPRQPNPFAPGRTMAWARVHGALLEGLGVRHDDHVALERTDRAEHGDLAAVADPSGRAALWRVYPEGRRLRLSTGDPAHARTTGPDPRVHGVVVGVLRKFSVAAATSRARPAGGESEAPSAHLPA